MIKSYDGTFESMCNDTFYEKIKSVEVRLEQFYLLTLEKSCTSTPLLSRDPLLK